MALLVAVALASGAGCKKGAPASHVNNQELVVHRSIPELAKIVTLPATPTEVGFEWITLGTPGGFGPTDYVLIAVLRFQPADLARITAAARHRPGSTPRITNTANRPWFPAPVKAAIHPSDDDSVMVTGTKFEAAAFTASSSFSYGDFIAVEGGEYIILVLGTT